MTREKALELLRKHSTYGQALENHCLRLAEFSLALGEHAKVPTDEDLIYTGCFLHDIGLCISDPNERNYLRRGAVFVRPHAEEWGLDQDQLKTLDQIMLFNHSLTPVPEIEPQAELVRLAVQVEHSKGAISHGLNYPMCHQVFDRHPRLDFNRVLLDFFKIALAEGGPVEIFRVFLPQGLGSLNLSSLFKPPRQSG